MSSDAVAAWQALLVDIDRSAGKAAHLNRSTIQALHQQFESLLGEGWRTGRATGRSKKQSGDSRLLGLRALRPLPSGDQDHELAGLDLQLQLVVAPSTWGVGDKEAKAWRSLGVQEAVDAIFLVQGPSDELVRRFKARNDRTVLIGLVWRLPPTSLRVGQSEAVPAMQAVARCFPESAVVRLNGDCQHDMNSLLLIAPRVFSLPVAAEELHDTVTEIEAAIEELQQLANGTLDDPGKAAALDAAAGDARRPPKEERAVQVQSETRESVEEVPPTDVEAGLRALLHAGRRLGGWPKSVVLHGPPGTGKTWSARRVARFLLEEPENLDEDPRFEVVVFHPSYGYDEFIGGIKVTTGDDGGVSYSTEPGVFTRLAERARENSDEVHIMLIDELNRGNLPKLFGELLYALEYRDRAVTVSFRGEPLVVPSNLMIIATMNTADRSAGALDAAVRRRFAFIRCGADSSAITYSPRLRKLHEDLNRHLLQHEVLRGLAVGHSYLVGQDAELLALKWQHQIVPLLEEYAEDVGLPVDDLVPPSWRGIRWQEFRLLTRQPDSSPDADDEA